MLFWGGLSIDRKAVWFFFFFFFFLLDTEKVDVVASVVMGGCECGGGVGGWVSGCLVVGVECWLV